MRLLDGESQSDTHGTAEPRQLQNEGKQKQLMTRLRVKEDGFFRQRHPAALCKQAPSRDVDGTSCAGTPHRTPVLPTYFSRFCLCALSRLDERWILCVPTEHILRSTTPTDTHRHPHQKAVSRPGCGCGCVSVSVLVPRGENVTGTNGENAAADKNHPPCTWHMLVCVCVSVCADCPTSAIWGPGHHSS